MLSCDFEIIDIHTYAAVNRFGMKKEIQGNEKGSVTSGKRFRDIRGERFY
jgi:hypothetical protein